MNLRKSDNGSSEQEALQWLARLTSGAATEADRAAFLRWRANPENEQVFRAALRVWKGVGHAVNADAALLAGGARSVRRRQFLQAGALAAGLGAVWVGGTKLGFWPSLPGMMADYATAAGERKSFAINNVRVELNTRTALSLGDSPKHMTLSAGEAVFTVGPGGGALRVSAGSGAVSSGQGAFSIRRDDAHIQITCLEGQVDILQPEKLVLRPSEQVICADNWLGSVRVVEMDHVASWRRGELIFRNERLENVVSELNRYRKGIVVIASRAVAERHVTGLFHLDRLDEALVHIQQALRIPMRQMSSYFVLLG